MVFFSFALNICANICASPSRRVILNILRIPLQYISIHKRVHNIFVRHVTHVVRLVGDRQIAVNCDNKRAAKRQAVPCYARDVWRRCVDVTSSYTAHRRGTVITVADNNNNNSAAFARNRPKIIGTRDTYDPVG